MNFTKTPYRISFFGGGSDFPEWYLKNGGGEVISTTINKYVYITVRELPAFFKHKYRIVYSKIEEVKNLSDIKHSVVRECLKRSGLSCGLEIHYDGDMPSKAGMGSSSSFTVGLIKAINDFKNVKLSKEKLASKSIHLERKILNECGGYQDQIAATYRGFNNIIFKDNGKILVKPMIKDKKQIRKFNNNLVLVYTGLTRNAHLISKNYVQKLNKSKKKNIYEILNHTQEAKKLFKSNNFDEVGLLLNETWKIKKGISNQISNKKIDDIYNLSLKNGALGGKLLGAGAGGFIVFYAKSENKKKLLKFYKNKKIQTIDFKFE